MWVVVRVVRGSGGEGRCKPQLMIKLVIFGTTQTAAPHLSAKKENQKLSARSVTHWYERGGVGRTT